MLHCAWENIYEWTYMIHLYLLYNIPVEFARINKQHLMQFKTLPS